MRRYRKWMKLLAVLVPGGLLSSCVTDLRDAAVTGAMDYVSGTITNTATAAWPVTEFLDRAWDVVFANAGL